MQSSFARFNDRQCLAVEVECDSAVSIGNQMIFPVQFGINKHKQIFKDFKKLHEPVGRVQFAVFVKFSSAYLFQIEREKSFDYFLMIYK